jgi:hypothetical protein
MSESMTGKMIMVNPDLPDDMIWRKGDIAIITKDELDSVTIRFDNDQFAKYGKEAVLAFKSPKEIYDHLEDEAMTMPKSNFRKLRNIAMLLEYGSEKQERTAMEIIQRNPALMLSALQPLGEKLLIDYTPGHIRTNPKSKIMENESLTGSLVLVHPLLENDPIKKQGEVGILTYARSESENYVSFPKGGESIYPANGLMLLKGKQDIVDQVMHNSTKMPTEDFKAIYKIMLLQDRGTSTALYDALEIARDHPGIWDKALEPVTRSERIELEKSYAR